jgi:hypothetical protein
MGSLWVFYGMICAQMIRLCRGIGCDACILLKMFLEDALIETKDFC